MKPETLFESMEYLDDSILEESETPISIRRTWKRWAAAAACICVVGAGVFASLHLGNGIRWNDPLEAVAPNPIYTTPIPMPDPNPSGENAYLIDPIPDKGTPPQVSEDVLQHPSLAWNDMEQPAASVADMSVMMVSEPLTGQQLAMTAPDTPPAWLEFSDGYACYYLHDGSGGLQSINLTAKNSLRGIDATVQILNPATPYYYGTCIMEPEPETVAGSYEGLQYTAYQYSYLHGEGDPKLYPPTQWLTLRLEFLRGDVSFRLSAEVPAEKETDAKNALADILYCYAHSESVPDLNSFHCREYLLRDEQPTLDEARSDPDFGAYLPEVPDGFPECDVRRYQFEEVQNYLHVFWYGGYDHVDWLVTYADENDLARLVSPEDKVSYDLSLYPIPWSDSVPEEKREIVDRPVFRVEELTLEGVYARAYRADEAGDTDSWRIHFSVLFPGNVLVRVETKGVSPDWVFEQINELR